MERKAQESTALGVLGTSHNLQHFQMLFLWVAKLVGSESYSFLLGPGLHLPLKIFLFRHLDHLFFIISSQSLPTRVVDSDLLQSSTKPVEPPIHPSTMAWGELRGLWEPLGVSLKWMNAFKDDALLHEGLTSANSKHMFFRNRGHQQY